MAGTFSLILSIVVWVVCLLFGTGIGIFAGKPVGTLLGWMVANSLDANMAQGGRFGQQIGRLLGVAIGVAAGVYAAVHLTAYIAQTVHP